MNKDKIYLIIIAVLFLFAAVTGYKWYFGSNSASKERVKQLEKEFSELEKRKKESDLRIAQWQSKFDSLKVEDSKLLMEIERLHKETQLAEIEAAKSKGKLDGLRKELAETRKKIEEFKKNPPNRTGESLLESLKNKTAKK